MHIDFTMLLNDAGLLIGFITALFGLNKKFPFLTATAHFLEDNAATIGQTVEKVAEEVIKTPIGAAIESKFKHEIDTITDNLQQSEIAKFALIGLHSFGLELAQLSDVQKTALIKFVVESVPAEWNITNDQVDKVLGEVQTAANAFSNLSIVTAANYFTEAQKNKISDGQGQAQ